MRRNDFILIAVEKNESWIQSVRFNEFILIAVDKFFFKSCVLMNS